MKIAVMADIHSNHVALERCVDEAKRLEADEYIFLGDYVGEMAYPERTLECLTKLKREYPCTFIRGNKENYWIDHKNGKHDDWLWQAGTSGSGMLLYSYTHLTDTQIKEFEKMPIAQTMQYDNMPPFVICHGSPFKVNESLREDYDYIDALTESLETELTICGHFHIQTKYVRNGKRVVNPGAVGTPLKSGGKAQFMMLSACEGLWDTEFHTLAYDVEKTIREMDEENLSMQAPGWYRVAKAILLGKDISQFQVLAKACELCEKEEGKVDWRCVPEKYWDRALTAFGI
ncbi:MAG: metallophosphoesterase family protein [Lachnospiraceae bacterium]|nr:metallophosphoesterase family protein [Lachnospiraceae bacterium]